MIGEVRVLYSCQSHPPVSKHHDDLPPNRRTLVERLMQFRQLRLILKALLQPRNLFDAIGRSERTLEHDCGEAKNELDWTGNNLERVTKRA